MSQVLGVSEGYLNNLNMTNEKFIDNPFSDKYKLYKTGDIVEFTNNGNLKFIGRNDDQVKMHGFRIELKEIEKNILANPEILDVFVTKKLDANEKQILVAYILTKKTQIDTSKLVAQLKETLPQYMIPYIVELKAFPLTPNGKIDAKALPLPEFKRTISTRHLTDTEIKILNVFQNVLKNKELQVEDNFFEIGGADSLDILSVNSILFTKDFKLNTQDFYKYPSVQELSAFLSKNSDEKYDIYEKFKKPNITKLPKSLRKNTLAFNFKNILLTGCTGFLGIHILDYLLKNTNSKIFCIIRRKYGIDPQKRLESSLNFYFGKDYFKKYKSNIIIIEGDLSNENFNLSKQDYAKLQNNVDCIINTASITKHYGNYSTFEKANINSVKNLILFAKESDIILNHISTTTISGNFLLNNNINYKFTENDFYIGQNYMDNVYVRSKFEAEKIIIEEESNGLKANIFRLGNLMARYSDGTFQKNKLDNAYYTRLLAFSKLGYLPDTLKHHFLEFTPVDEAATAIIKILEIPYLKNGIFHIFSDKLISIDVLINVLKHYNCNCKFIDYDNFIEKLYLQKNEKILKYIISDLNTYKKFNYSSNIIVDQSITNEFLNFVSFKWSTLDEKYLTQFFDNTNFSKDVNL